MNNPKIAAFNKGPTDKAPQCMTRQLACANTKRRLDRTFFFLSFVFLECVAQKMSEDTAGLAGSLELVRSDCRWCGCQK